MYLVECTFHIHVQNDWPRCRASPEKVAGGGGGGGTPSTTATRRTFNFQPIKTLVVYMAKIPWISRDMLFGQLVTWSGMARMQWCRRAAAAQLHDINIIIFSATSTVPYRVVVGTIRAAAARSMCVQTTIKTLHLYRDQVIKSNGTLTLPYETYLYYVK